ncbi:helix-turn-helix domain-containing protein [Arthrobacter sp. JSM 101049]|uniref:helix-turn-helix domain-containing protein n=1 Tax=Arthrobacter sp. JSM 101049 TaxID=929097 RepID=UPI0035654628
MTAEAHTPVEALIDRVQPGFSSDQLADALERALERLKPTDTAALTSADQTFWDQHSGIPSEPRLVANAMAASVAAATLHEAGSLGSQEVALRLGLRPSTVRRYVLDRKLYSFKTNGRMLFPSWQFTGTRRPLPHLAEILAALPPGSHPQTVQGFFTTPQPDLRLSGEAATPRDWLISGGEPDLVVALASSVGRL